MAFPLKNWLQSGQAKGEAELNSYFGRRPKLDNEAFFDNYFGGTDVNKEIAIGVRELFITSLPFDMRRLAPDDNFKGELSFVWRYDSLADVELLCAIEKRFDVKISTEEARDAATMGDIIRLVQSKQPSKHA
jgi:acyl carrier protein